MTKAEKDNLIKQIFASEFSFLEIEKRANELEAKNPLTRDEERILSDYKKKLQHDKSLIKTWLKKLKTAGIGNINTTGLKEIRKAIFDKLIAEEQKAATDLDEEISKLEEAELSEEDRQTATNDFNKRKIQKEKRVTILEELKTKDKNTWQQ